MNILLIDDDKAVRQSLQVFIAELGHDVTCASNGKEGLELFEKNNYNLILTDIMMPKMDGFELLHKIKTEKNSMIDVVIITGHSDTDSAITALREGAYDYLRKPINVEELAVVIDHVSEHLSLKIINEELTSKFDEQVKEKVSETEKQLEKFRIAFRDKIGLNISIHSKKIGDIFVLAEKYHQSPTVPVLIEGETGTGKELLARYIHYWPEMATKPFIAINCAAIPLDLFESELFGHEAGAFTGARTGTKKGQIEMAGDGTLLLDEIGEMPLSTQVKLLRVIEEREYYRVGGVKRLRLDARIIASTNKSLKNEIDNKQFRSDLYHRLNVGYLKIPPLAERKEEIIPLTYDFLKKSCTRHGKQAIQGFTVEAEHFLESISWPGNVRQLENTIERIVLLNDGPLIDVDKLHFLECYQGGREAPCEENVIDLGNENYFVLPREGIDLDVLTTQLVKKALEMSGGNKTLAAKLLNISTRTISRRLEKE